MKLYISPGACSLSPHIVMYELGMTFDLEKIDKKTKKTTSGENFLELNPNGYIPALKLDDGKILTEGVAIVQYLADQKPEAQLAPKAGTFDRYRLIEWLNFIATELHKGFSPLFSPKISDEMKSAVVERLGMRFSYVDKQLSKMPFLMGKNFTVADAYLYTILTWAPYAGLKHETWPNLEKYFKAISDRPAVQKALKAEKDLK